MLHDAALGLDYLHKKGLVHGHLKLSNILVGADGQAKLADFGLDAVRRCSTFSKKLPDAAKEDDLRWRTAECLENCEIRTWCKRQHSVRVRAEIQ
ncbi:hypothetical protein PHYSODRAFT_469139 [Phytophthora sojae]|uniref:Protein kinase domain-containing protein n=1 Tax=Phytophthora sojae (strain P6497) TaxID=1094619 RepID=G4YHJ0_PHYSP|nr:hypothetical protein PHYSODRAFT_469139 [Phytophthora sojae]EGZ29095.1 hypothetical protein PHYSODRAFT_469139 [Phytophthora sojae]|eukprot:XP_009516370.1 hypothetical protein PHYSODRAFT_469139 [Phytophthora sojae]